MGLYTDRLFVQWLIQANKKTKQKIIQISRYSPIVNECIGDAHVDSPTEGRWRDKCSNLMTYSWIVFMQKHHYMYIYIYIYGSQCHNSNNRNVVCQLNFLPSNQDIGKIIFKTIKVIM